MIRAISDAKLDNFPDGVPVRGSAAVTQEKSRMPGPAKRIALTKAEAATLVGNLRKISNGILSKMPVITIDSDSITLRDMTIQEGNGAAVGPSVG